MSRQQIVRRVSIAWRQFARALGKWAPDLHVYAGIGAMAYGASLLLPGTLGVGAGFIVLGLGLVWIVRYGADATVRR